MARGDDGRPGSSVVATRAEGRAPRARLLPVEQAERGADERAHRVAAQEAVVAVVMGELLAQADDVLVGGEGVVGHDAEQLAEGLVLGAVAVDARIVIDHAGPTARDYQHLAILPYPSRYEREWPMKGGDLYTIRPIRPDDADMLQAFTRGLSEESRYFRFASAMHELPARMLARYTLIDYDREMALVAVHTDRVLGEDGEFVETEKIIGVSRYITNPDQTTCEFSLVVSDDYKGQGLGSRLMLSIEDFARDKGLAHIEGLVLANNPNMLRLMRGLGYEVRPFPEDPDFKLVVRAL